MRDEEECGVRVDSEAVKDLGKQRRKDARWREQETRVQEA